MPRVKGIDGRFSATPFQIESETEAAWLAGLLEGDGSFGAYTNGFGVRFPVIQFVNTDKLLIDTVAKMLGTGNRISVTRSASRKGEKDCFRCDISGRIKVPQVLRLLLPHLRGEKRVKVLRIIEEFQ